MVQVERQKFLPLPLHHLTWPCNHLFYSSKAVHKYALGKDPEAQVVIDKISDITSVEGAVLPAKEEREGWRSYLGRYKGAFSELSTSVIPFDSFIIIVF